MVGRELMNNDIARGYLDEEEEDMYGTIKPPQYPLLASAVTGARDLQRSLAGSPMEFMFPESLVNIGERWAYGEEADTMDKAFGALDLGDVIPGVGAVTAVPRKAARSTIRGAQRKAYPGVYSPVDELLADVKVAPESENLGRLFDTSRSELASIADRPGNIPGNLPGAAANPKGSAAAGPVTAPANTARLRDNLEQVRGTPLEQGMKGWYVMDPMYQRILALVGGDHNAAKAKYTQLNTLSGMASPGSNVLTEINRGSAANYLQNQGRFDEFRARGGKPEGDPNRIPGVLGHPYHSTAQSTPMEGYLSSGEVQLKSPKVPLYIDASGVPETGFQTEFPVGDAHWSRGVGLADTRTNKGFGASYSNPEAQQLAPWWRDDVAGPAGYESVPAQAISWGLYGPQTGVDTPVGAPKLELWADEIYRDAMTRGMSPELLRDRVLMGEDFIRR